MPNLSPVLTLYHDDLILGSRIVLFVIRNLSLDVNLQPINNLLNLDRIHESQIRAPTLIDHTQNDFTLTDSRVICSYLVESHRNGHSLFPNDIIRRAVINQRLYFDANTLVPRLEDIIQTILSGYTRDIPKEKRDRLKESLIYLNGFLELDKYVAGNEPTIADLTIVCAITAVKQLGVHLDEHPLVQKWYKNCKELPGFTEMENATMDWAQGIKDRMSHDGYY